MVMIIIVLLAVLVLAILAFIIKQKELKKIQDDYELMIRQYKKMTELNYKKKALIGIASHDLSTPLASIDMWTQLLKSSEDNLEAEQKRSIEMIHEAVHYGQRLIRKIAELENVIPAKIAIEHFDFSSLMISIAEDLKHSLKNNIQFLLKVHKPVFLLSDKTMIKKMCEAVLSSSICNASDNSKVQASIYSEDDEIIFQVKYAAVDITKNKLLHLFSDYKQISSSKEKSLEISGLSVAQRIVEELNGQIFSETSDSGNSIITVKFKNN